MDLETFMNVVAKYFYVIVMHISVLPLVGFAN